MKEQIENEMKLEFISKASNEAFARITVAAFASQLDPTIEELADIKTAVSEAGRSRSTWKTSFYSDRFS